MDGAILKITEPLEEIAKQRFLLKVKLDAENERFTAEEARLQEDHRQRLAVIEAEIEALDPQIRGTILKHRETLFARGKKSFATMTTIFKTKSIPAQTRILDKNGIMAVARRRRVVRQFAKEKRTWVFDQKLFFDWLSKHPEQRKHFADYLIDVPGGIDIRIVPNGNYTVLYDGKRITPLSIKIE